MDSARVHKEGRWAHFEKKKQKELAIVGGIPKAREILKGRKV